MSKPRFYLSNPINGADQVELDEENSRHMVQVLRMGPGELFELTDGQGHLYSAELLQPNKKKCVAAITGRQFIDRSLLPDIAISLLKNTSRFEWFLEKATEIGVRTVMPMICERTEKHHFRSDRMKGILISALLQSQQVWLPEMREPMACQQLIPALKHQQAFIAYCEDKPPANLVEVIDESKPERIVLIGPEGDFTSAELTLAKQHQLLPVGLGPSRLRTETAGVVALTLLNAQIR